MTNNAHLNDDVCHLRSNVEAAFVALKYRFVDGLRGGT